MLPPLRVTPMSNPPNAEYFSARARESRNRTASATDPRAAAAHADMAARYERLAAEFDPHRAPQMLPADWPQIDHSGELSAEYASLLSTGLADPRYEEKAAPMHEEQACLVVGREHDVYLVEETTRSRRSRPATSALTSTPLCSCLQCNQL